MPARTPGKHALTFVAITVLLDVIGFSLIIPVMPALLIDLTGETVDRVALYSGWLGFVYALMQFVFAPVLGNLSDHFGRRPVLLIAILAVAADYVLMAYGTGAIMAVPGQDQRDWDFAKKYDIEIIRTVQPPDDFDGDAYTGEGPAINSGFLDGLEVDEAIDRIIDIGYQHAKEVLATMSDEELARYRDPA